MRRWPWIALAAAGPLTALVGWLARNEADFFEPVWGRTIAPGVAHVQGLVTGAVPFSVAEVGGGVLGLGVLGWLTTRTLQDRSLGRRERLAGFAGRLGRLLAIGSGFWAFFLLAWGYAAHRHTAGELLGFEVRPASTAELGEALEELLEQQEDARARVTERDGVATIRDGVQSVLSRAGAAWRRAADARPIFAGDYGRPKPVFFSSGLTALGLLGIYTPFTGEANVNTDAPWFTLPASACHEMAHQRGFAREDEANFLAFLVTRDSGDAELRYAGLFFAVQNTAVALGEVDPDTAAGLWSSQSAAIKRDRAAWSAWVTGHQSVVTEAARAVNDTYLRSQGAPDGVQSYGRMVDLILAERRAR